MTYYGRWRYKHEMAEELGAAGSLVIHETGPAGYPWEVIGAKPFGESFDLAAPDDNLGRPTFEGWVQRATAESIFELAGLDFETAKQQAAVRGFEPIPLGLTGSIEIRNEIRRIDSRNVVAKVEGAEAPDEALIYVAHWDHVGRDESLEGDQIFNGARRQRQRHGGAHRTGARLQPVRPPAAPVGAVPGRHGEEAGLLGSFHYTRNPFYPVAQTVAALNMDMLNQWGRTRDLTIVGLGQSELDDVAADVAEQLGRTLAPDPEPEKGFFYRSDHFAFARARYSGLLCGPGHGVHRPSRKAMERRSASSTPPTTTTQVTDEVKPDWDMAGAVEDLTFLYLMGRAAGRRRGMAVLERNQRVPGVARVAASAIVETGRAGGPPPAARQSDDAHVRCGPVDLAPQVRGLRGKDQVAAGRRHLPIAGGDFPLQLPRPPARVAGVDAQHALVGSGGPGSPAARPRRP